MAHYSPLRTSLALLFFDFKVVTVFAGHYGSIELKRLGEANPFNLYISAEDLDVARKRFTLSESNGLDLPFGTITTGDRVRLTTADSRGLPFRLYTNAANTTFIDNPAGGNVPIEFFANVDAMGAIRMYRTFADASLNSGSQYLAIPLSKSLSSGKWNVSMTLLPGSFNEVGRVQGFTLSTERETADTTSLGDKYKHFSASAISGSGSVDCLFDLRNVGAEELPLAIAQIIQKIEIGSRFAGKFYILEPFGSQPLGYAATEGVFYQVEGMFVRSSMTVRADQIVECSFDFITSGEFLLRAGDNPVAITTEDNVSIGNDATLDELGVLIESD
jgi:hypothetical protein